MKESPVFDSECRLTEIIQCFAVYMYVVVIKVAFSANSAMCNVTSFTKLHLERIRKLHGTF